MRGVPLRLLLKDPRLLGSRVLAGAAGLDARVVWLVSSADPYVIPESDLEDILFAREEAWIGGFRPEGLERLARSGAVALFSESHDREALPGPALLETRHDLERACERLGLPLVSLPIGRGYRDVSRALAGLLLSRNADAVPEGSAETAHGDAELSRALDGIAREEGRRLAGVCFPKALIELRDWPDIKAAVREYLRLRGNAVAAAQALGVHRHTVRSRVRRYEALSGLSLDDPASRPLVELAFLLEARPPTKSV